MFIEEKSGDFADRPASFQCRLVYAYNVLWSSLVSHFNVKQFTGHQLIGHVSVGEHTSVVFEQIWHKSEFLWLFLPSLVFLCC